MRKNIRRIKKYSLIFPFSLILLSGGCEKEIDFKYKYIEPILVIEGALSQNSAEISLTLTTPMDEPMDLAHLTDAEVSITDLTTGETVDLRPDNTGIFRHPKGGVMDHEYLLTVFRQNKKFSSSCIMKEEVEITGMEFSWIKMPYDDVAVLQVSFRDNPATSDDCYWIRIYRNGEAYQWVTVPDLLAENGIINQVLMTSRRDTEEEDEADRLEEGDLVTATVVPITRSMHDYLEALSIGNSNGPRMFDGPLCLGYFLAAPVSSRSVIFSPDDMPRYY